MNPTSPSKVRSWEIKPSTGSHFEVLDGLRGVAILMVVVLHTLYTNPEHGVVARVLGLMITSGWVGVPIFFVLSGFLISYPFFKQRHRDSQFWYPKGYVLRRIGKIVPPFYLSIAFFLIFYWFRFHDPAYFYSALKWASWCGSYLSIDPLFNGPYWSLMIEAQFYILLPLLFWSTRSMSVRRSAMVFFLLLFALPIVMRHVAWPAGVTVLPDYFTDAAKLVSQRLSQLPCQIDYFAYGIFFAGMYASLGKSVDNLRVLSVLGYLGLLLLILFVLLWAIWSDQFDIRAHPTRWSVEFNHFLPGLAGFLLLFFVFDPNCVGSRLLGMPMLRFTGIVSFEWFLLHWPITNWFAEMFGHTHGNLWAYFLKTIFPLALTFGLSVLVYRWFSLPILNWARERVRKT